MKAHHGHGPPVTLTGRPLYISIYYIVSKIHIDELLLEGYFYFYSQQIILAGAKESVISYNLAQRVLETQNH